MSPPIATMLPSCTRTMVSVSLMLLDASGNVELMHHAPSGAFRPSIDSFGRVVFTNWDHLQRDQQAGASGYFNHRDESAGAVTEPIAAGSLVKEVFPEPRFGAPAPLNDHSFNFFLPCESYHPNL